jgi:hypothetical protein
VFARLGKHVKTFFSMSTPTPVPDALLEVFPLLHETTVDRYIDRRLLAGNSLVAELASQATAVSLIFFRSDVVLGNDLVICHLRHPDFLDRDISLMFGRFPNDKGRPSSFGSSSGSQANDSLIISLDHPDSTMMRS